MKDKKSNYSLNPKTKNKVRSLIIYGAAYFDILKLVYAINQVEPTWQILGFIDDTPVLTGKKLHGYPVLGGREVLAIYASNPWNDFFNNVHGKWNNNKLIAGLLDDFGCPTPNLIHTSIDMNMVEIGRGCYLPDGCIIGSGSRIGNFLTARLRSLISHDVIIEDHVFIGPGAIIGGCSFLKKGCFIGTGATIMACKTIGEGSIVGAGALVTKDVPPNVIVTGVPAKILKEI